MVTRSSSFQRKASACIGLAALTALFVVKAGPTEVGAAREHETAGYQVPDIAQFILVDEYEADGDGDGVKETVVRRYWNTVGDRVFSMTTRGRVWAWSLESRSGDARDLSRNYVIRDSDCDGIFDERFGLDAEFHVPACLK
jgi:hypothetical protein